MASTGSARPRRPPASRHLTCEVVSVYRLSHLLTNLASCTRRTPLPLQLDRDRPPPVSRQPNDDTRGARHRIT
jgi:hypothetical protein